MLFNYMKKYKYNQELIEFGLSYYSKEFIDAYLSIIYNLA